MNNIIITTPEELRALISEAVSNAIPVCPSPKEQPDTINLDTAIKVLEEYGYPTAKATIYKLTATGSMPFRKYGNKLIFSRKELLNWAEQQAYIPKDRSDVINSLHKSVKRKRPGKSMQ